MSSFSKAHQQWATFARVWYLLDGKMQPPGKLAALASVKLQGLHKPMYHQLKKYGESHENYVELGREFPPPPNYSSPPDSGAAELSEHDSFPLISEKKGRVVVVGLRRVIREDAALHCPRMRDCGDHVVIINTRHIAFSGNKWEQKVYSSHTGYPGGFKQVTAAQLHQQDPVAIVKLAIYGMLPKNLHRRTMMQRLHLFPDESIPEDILQNLAEELPQPRKVPRRLDEYTREEVDAFPRLWTPPEDFRL